jgi:hypothetical protein
VVYRGFNHGDIILTGAAQTRRYADSSATTTDDHDFVVRCAFRSVE